MARKLIPDAQKVVSKYVRERPEIVALGARVVTKTPTDRSIPWIRVTRLDANPNAADTADHLTSFLLQLDCYAGSEGGLPEANLLGRTVRAVLGDIASYDNDDAIFTGSRITGDTSSPDTALEPARDRTILTAVITGHAA